MTRDDQIEKIKQIQNKANKILEQLENIEDKDKSDIIQRQSAEKAIRDLKKAGAHIGYANANRHMDDAIGRLRGVATTNPAVTVSMESAE